MSAEHGPGSAFAGGRFVEDKGFERIEKLFTRLSDDFGRKLEEQDLQGS